jgi:hypothetical protein
MPREAADRIVYSHYPLKGVTMKRLILFLCLLLAVPAWGVVNEVTPARTDLVATGGVTFSSTFKVNVKTDIVVYVNGVLKAVDTDYTVSGLGVSGGATVTFLSAPASGAKVAILRKQPVQQTSVYQSGEAFPSKRLEGDLDKETMISQQLAEEIGRIPILSPASAYRNLSLPDPVAGSILQWKTDSTGLQNINPVSYPATFSSLTALTCYTYAGLPPAPPAGTLACVSDTIRGVWKYSGTQWVSLTHHADVADFGASPTATSAVNAAAIQAAVTAAAGVAPVYIGQNYTTSAPIVDPGSLSLILEGPGQSVASISNSTTDLFTIGNHDFNAGTKLVMHGLSLNSGVGGGHILNASGATTISGSHIYDMAFSQGNNAKSVWLSGTATIFVDNLIETTFTQHTLTASVPSWSFPTNGGDVNANTWFRDRFSNSGNYNIKIDNVNGGSANYQVGNSFRDLVFEYPQGGAIEVVGGFHTLFDGIGIWDMAAVGAMTQPFITMANAPGATGHSGTTFRNVGVYAGRTHGAGIAAYDIYFDTSYNVGNTNIVFENTGENVFGLPLLVNLNGNAAVPVGGLNGLALINPTKTTVGNAPYTSSFTQDTSSTTPTVVTGVGFTPSLVTFQAGVMDTVQWSIGTDTGTTKTALCGSGTAGQVENYTTYSILLFDGGTGSYKAKITALSGDGFTITGVVAGGKTGTATILFTAYP